MKFIKQFLLGAHIYCLLPLRNSFVAAVSEALVKPKVTSSVLTTPAQQIANTTFSTMADQQQQCSKPSSSSSSSSYDSGSTSVAFVTTPDENSAKKIAHALVTQKLAACVNLIPNLTSIYHWEGKINEDSEILLMIKTRTNRIDELTKFVRENHPYSVAEVITLPIENGNLPYLEWILKTVPDKK